MNARKCMHKMIVQLDTIDDQHFHLHLSSLEIAHDVANETMFNQHSNKLHTLLCSLIRNLSPT